MIDVRAGRAVHAVAGRRGEYQMIDRSWCVGGDPVQLSSAYQPLVSGLYIADLDAIINSSQNSVDSIQRLIKTTPLRPIWLDAGWGRAEWRPAYDEILSQVRIVVGTETLVDFDQLQDLVYLAKNHGTEVTLSLDLRAGKLVSPRGYLDRCSVSEIAQRAQEIGVQSMIVLDLAGVGLEAGPRGYEIIRQLRTLCGELISGGGVRGAEDVLELIEAGCDRVLAATWLHRQFQV